MERYLTVKEAAFELRIAGVTVLKLIKTGQLVAQNISTGKTPEYRILDPAPALRAKHNSFPTENFPLITAHDLSPILGLNHQTIKWHVFKGHLKPYKKGHGTLLLFTPKEIRRFVAEREGRRRQSRYTTSAIIVKWLKAYLEDAKPDGKILDELIQKAVECQEPDRSRIIRELWLIFDRVNVLLDEALKLQKR